VGQGKGGVGAAVELMAGKKVADYVDIPYVLVTPANIKDYQGAN
jgi:inositol transport system substrate-binding protein